MSRRQPPRWTWDEEAVLRRVWPKASREDVLLALPTRTWEGLRQRAKSLGIDRPTLRQMWSPEDLETLRRLWPLASWDEIRAAFPRRTDKAIARMGALTKARRRPEANSKAPGRVDPLFVALRRARERQGITRVQLADMLGYHHVQIARWELGHQPPRFQALRDWLDGLGCDLVVTQRELRRGISSSHHRSAA